jgi:polar amino acid transport system substrate-binding protein
MGDHTGRLTSAGRRAFAALAVGALLGCGVALADSAKTVRLTNGEWQPYLSKDVPHYGIASHIVTEAFALVGVEVEYGFFPWSRAMKLAKDGTWDGTAVWGDSEERQQNFYFSEPVVPSTFAFFHLKSSPFDWSTYEDLSDLKVGGTVEYFYSDEFEAAEAAGVFATIRARSDEVGLKNLLKGRIDVFPGELMVTYAQIRDTFSEEEAALFTHHSKRIVKRPQHLLLSRKVAGNEEMRDRFNEGLRQLKESGRYDQIFADALAGEYAKPE